MPNFETKKTYGLAAGAKNKKLIAQLNEKGESVLIFPSIQAEKLELTGQKMTILTNLSGFDWLILTDVLAADFFIETLREIEYDLFELDGFTICALGEAVSDRLRFEQIHSDVIPTKIKLENIISAISEFAADTLEKVRFLVLKESKTEFAFIDKLRESKAEVEELAVYTGKFESDSTNIKLKTLLKGGAVDEFIFSSEEDLISLQKLFPGEDLALVFAEIKISATTETVFQALLENGFRPLYFHFK